MEEQEEEEEEEEEEEDILAKYKNSMRSDKAAMIITDEVDDNNG